MGSPDVAQLSVPSSVIPFFFSLSPQQQQQMTLYKVQGNLVFSWKFLILSPPSLYTTTIPSSHPSFLDALVDSLTGASSLSVRNIAQLRISYRIKHVFLLVSYFSFFFLFSHAQGRRVHTHTHTQIPFFFKFFKVDMSDAVYVV